MEIDKQAIGKRIRSIRLGEGKNTREFGEMFTPHASDSIVSRWESGKSIPNNERLKKIAELGNMSVDDLLSPPLESLIKQYLDEIMAFEIKQGDQKYKILYDPDDKANLIQYLLRQDYEGLTLDYGVRYEVKEQTEKYLNKRIELSKFFPFTNDNAKLYSFEELWKTIRKIDEYFKADSIESKETDSFLKDDQIRQGLSPELYHKIRVAFENLSDELRSIDIID